jgi:hypothetical protein
MINVKSGKAGRELMQRKNTVPPFGVIKESFH